MTDDDTIINEIADLLCSGLDLADDTDADRLRLRPIGVETQGRDGSGR